MGQLHACMHDPFLLYNHEQWAVYSYNLSIGQPAVVSSSSRAGGATDRDLAGLRAPKQQPPRTAAKAHHAPHAAMHRAHTALEPRALVPRARSIGR
jgi:hypothetical protein